MLEYVYSLDNEFYHSCGNLKKPEKIFELAKKEHNIKDYLDDNILVIYYGKKEEFEPYLYGDDIIDLLKEQAYSELDDENYLDDIKKEEKDELKEKLNQVLKSFLKKKNIKPNKFLVKDITKFYLTKQGDLIKTEKEDD